MPLHTPLLKSSIFSGDECTSGGDKCTPGDNMPGGILASYLATAMCVGNDVVTRAVATCNATYFCAGGVCDDDCGEFSTVFEGPNDLCIPQLGAGLSLRFECSTCRTATYTSELNLIGLASGNPLEGVPSCYSAEQPVSTVLGGNSAAHEGNQHAR